MHHVKAKTVGGIALGRLVHQSDVEHTGLAVRETYIHYTYT